MTEPSDDATYTAIRVSAVRMLNRGGLAAVTVSAVCADTGIDEAEFTRHYPSLAAVFDAVVEALMVAHAEKLSSSMVRRRSLTESFRIALRGYWDVVEANLAEHQAVKYLSFAGVDAEQEPGTDRPAHTLYLVTTERRLLEMARLHQVTWELPVRQLARLMLAMLDGLLLDYLVHRDRPGVYRLLDIFAYDLAQHGRRVAKNHPH